MMTRKRKVCISGPPRLTLPQEMLKGSGYELILGKPVDDFPGIHYKKEDLISLIGDADGLLVSTREGVGRDILEARAVVPGVALPNWSDELCRGRL